MSMGLQAGAGRVFVAGLGPSGRGGKSGAHSWRGEPADVPLRCSYGHGSARIDPAARSGRYAAGNRPPGGIPGLPIVPSARHSDARAGVAGRTGRRAGTARSSSWAGSMAGWRPTRFPRTPTAETPRGSARRSSPSWDRSPRRRSMTCRWRAPFPGPIRKAAGRCNWRIGKACWIRTRRVRCRWRAPRSGVCAARRRRPHRRYPSCMAITGRAISCMTAPAGYLAVLDWEMAHLGDPLEDLGWAIDPLWGHFDRGARGRHDRARRGDCGVAAVHLG